MIVVVTGASAGVGRAAALEFARRGWDVAVLARNLARLERVAEKLRGYGVRALPVVADVADCDAVKAAAGRVEHELGPIDVWVNNAMATAFAPVAEITPQEVRRATEVTYLGQVHGMMTALSHMRPRNRGTIVNVGSALAYRAIPLQSVYCGAKFAVRGFTDSLRSELIHDNCPISLVMVHLPAVNTPQFDWALNKMGKRTQPVPPIFQPEVPARAIAFAAENPHHREIWVGFSTIKAIVGNAVAPGLLDRYLAKAGYNGQLTDDPLPPDAPANLFDSVNGDFGAHGRFDGRARRLSWEMFTRRHADAAAVVLLGLLAVGAAGLLRAGAARRRFQP
ncbi:MAG TPA: SDR family oxidoreductase [Stellaceae bacterium]|jgi:NAD(P)-dependent dehydrogenase (short-subunit alcohol dehydrogenase family)